MICTSNKFLACLSLSLLLAGCAANVTHAPAVFAPAAEATRSLFKLEQVVELRLATGYNRTLAAGSEWRRVGRIAQGDVYKPNNAIFTLEGAHVHEAWLVVADGRLVGFYLPVEHGFSPNEHAIDLRLSSTQTIREQ
jgi:hypothetical protein